jgi:phosphomannomutase
MTQAPVSAALRAEATEWADADPDPRSRAAVLAALDIGDGEALSRWFGPALRFGTAGLRGPMQPGPAGMNTATVRRAAAGVARWLLDRPDSRRNPGGRPQVVIGHDARLRSADFAADVADVLSGQGVAAMTLPGPEATPVLAFAVRHLEADAGVMVTASHNPAVDNGLKVYAADGAQIVSPADLEIEAAIGATGPAADLPLGDGWELLGDAIRERYLDAVVSRMLVPTRAIRIAYTPLHGVGASLLLEAFDRAGFPGPVVEPSQRLPDPAFPTVPFPNPEEPGALDRVLALAAEMDPPAPLVLANDPDADRCAAAVDGRVLTGDEVGVLLADHLLRHRRGTVATTVVSSSMLAAIAADAGVPFVQTLTGFKWLVRAEPAPLLFAYEEALGYAVAPDIVRDKDGISAALLLSERAAELASEGKTLLDRLDELACRYGLHLTSQVSIRLTNPAELTLAMRRIRADPPASLAGLPVAWVRDLLQPDTGLPAGDVLILTLTGGRVALRPSGTEPKLKAYLEVVRPVVGGDIDAARTDAEEVLAALTADVTGLLAG